MKISELLNSEDKKNEFAVKLQEVCEQIAESTLTKFMQDGITHQGMIILGMTEVVNLVIDKMTEHRKEFRDTAREIFLDGFKTSMDYDDKDTAKETRK